MPFKAQKVAMIKNNSINSNIPFYSNNWQYYTDGCAPVYDSYEQVDVFARELQKLNLRDFFKISKTVQVRALGIFMGGIEVF